jgi:hypothetical protein
VDESEQRIGADCKANECEDIREPHGAPGVGFHRAWQALGKDLPHTLCVGTEETADMQFQAHGAAHLGQIGDHSFIARMNPRGSLMTKRTLRVF